MVFAPPLIDLTDDAHASAAVDATVDLHEYACCWQRALSGKPVHFDSLEIKEYFIGAEELKALQTLYDATDKRK